MNDTERTSFTQALVLLAEIHGRKLSSLALDGWWQEFATYPLGAVLGALKDLRGGLARFPTPKDLHDLLDGRPEDMAEAEWAFVLDMLRVEGTYANVDFEDDATNQIIHEWGGWATLGEKLDVPDRELGFLRREFTQRWLALYHQPPMGTPQQHLGRHALVNAGMAGQWTRGAGYTGGTVKGLRSGEVRALGAPRGTALVRRPPEAGA